MKIFVSNDTEKYFIDDSGQILLDEKPVFSFEYDKLFYSNTLARKNETQVLTEEEMNEIDEFILEYRKNNNKAFCVDNTGNYLGYLDYNNTIHKKVPYPPADSTFIWNFEKKDWLKKYYYDNTGKQVVNESDSVNFTIKVPPSSDHIFSEQDDEWKLNYTATNENELITKIKIVAALFYYMDFSYGSQTFLKDIVSNIKAKAIVDNKTDLSQLCDDISTLIDNCSTAVDKKELEKQLCDALLHINNKVMDDITDPVFLKTNTWESISSL